MLKLIELAGGSSRAKERRVAADALLRIDREFEFLISRLDEAESAETAAFVLGRVQSSTAAGRVRLAELLPRGGQVAAAAQSALTRIGVPALPELLAAVQAGSPRAALECIAQFGPSAQSVVPDLMVMLRGADEELASRLIYTLRRLHAVDALAAVAGSPQATLSNQLPKAAFDRVRKQALRGLGDNPEAVDRTLPVLIGCLSEEDVRLEAALAVRDIGGAASAAAPHLASMLRDGVPDEMSVASQALVALGEAAVEHVIPMLRQAHPKRREVAAATLAGIGPAARGSVPVLRDALTDPLESVGRASAIAIARILPPDRAARMFLEAVHLPSAASASDLASRLPPLSGLAAPILVDALRHGSPPEAALSKTLLTRMGRKSLPYLIEVASSEGLDPGIAEVLLRLETELRFLEPHGGGRRVDLMRLSPRLDEAEPQVILELYHLGDGPAVSFFDDPGIGFYKPEASRNLNRIQADIQSIRRALEQRPALGEEPDPGESMSSSDEGPSSPPEPGAEAAGEMEETGEEAESDDRPTGPERERFTDVAILNGHFFKGEAVDDADRLDAGARLVPGASYLLEIAIRSERRGVGVEVAPRPVEPPRRDREAVTIYVAVAAFDEASVVLEDSLLPIEWPFDSDSSTAYFRFQPLAQLGSDHHFDIRLLSEDLRLLDHVELVFEQSRWLLRHNELPPAFPQGEFAEEALSFHVINAPNGYALKITLKRKDRPPLDVPLGLVYRPQEVAQLLADVRRHWTALVIGTMSKRPDLTKTSFKNETDKLASLGRRAWRLLFGDRRGAGAGAGEALAQLLKDRPITEGSPVRISYASHAEDFTFPWSVVSPPPSNETASEPHFWGLDYEIVLDSKGGPVAAARPVRGPAHMRSRRQELFEIRRP